jgi:DNA (cytosine-5)-methyltransferase 3A
LNNRGLRVLSLCGGVETGLLTLQRLNIPIEEYCTYEILSEAIAVSSYHFPFINHCGDLYKANFEQFIGFDLVLAGTCCQSLSRIRIENEEINNGLMGKSGIFFKAIEAINVIKPRWIMFENVIPTKSEDLNTMTQLIGIDPILINSNLFSAQDRERYYWTNIKLDKLPVHNSLMLKDIMEENVSDKYYYNKPFKITNMDKKVCGELLVNTTEMCKRIYNPNYKMATLTCVSGGYQEKKVLDNGKPRKLTEIEYERLQGVPDNFTNVKVNGKKLSYAKRCSLMGNGWNEPTVEFILSNLKQYI